jgi:hypothetical protein
MDGRGVQSPGEIVHRPGHDASVVVDDLLHPMKDLREGIAG